MCYCLSESAAVCLNLMLVSAYSDLVHLRICVILCSAPVCICLNLHLFGLHRHETPSNT
ncbi:hypothetical protein Tco_1526273, partial [Tanacetum coccineum]